MDFNMTAAMMQATVMVSQVPGPGLRTKATGFLVSAPRADGSARIVLVTANHVLERIPESEVRIGFHVQGVDGAWAYVPQPEPLRQDGRPLWTRHPDRDVAVLTLSVPPEIARAAIPAGWLADRDTFDRYAVGPGDEMGALGFPEGLASSGLGFAILRVGRVASYPLSPVSAAPTFLLDFHVFPGNSGGPIFMTGQFSRRPDRPDADPPPPPPAIVVGVLTQQISPAGEALELGQVTHAVFVREALALLDKTPQAQRERTRRLNVRDADSPTASSVRL